MQTIVASSSEPAVSEAVKAIAGRFKNPKLILFFAPHKSFLQATKFFWQHFPQSLVLGTSSPLTYSSVSACESAISAVAFEDGIECSASVIGEIGSHPSKYRPNVEKALAKVPAKNTVCLEFMTAFSMKESVVLGLLGEVCLPKAIPVVGGCAGVDMRSSDFSCKMQTFVSLNGKTYVNACVFAFVHNLGGKIALFKESIFTPTKQSFTITEVDFKTQTVLKLNDEVPTKVLAHAFRCDEENLQFVFRSYPLGLLVGSNCHVAVILDINSDGTIKFARSIYNFTKLAICSPQNYHDITRNTLAGITAEIPKPSFVFLATGFSRLEFYRQEQYAEEWLTEWQSHVGCFLGFAPCGEQFLGQNFNQLLQAVVFE